MDEEKPKYPLITDGVIQHATLEMIDKDEAWLLAALQAQGYAEVDAVFLAEYGQRRDNGGRGIEASGTRVLFIPLRTRQKDSLSHILLDRQ